MATAVPGFPIDLFFGECHGLTDRQSVARLRLWWKAWTPLNRGTLPDDNAMLCGWASFVLTDDFIPERPIILGDFRPSLEQAGRLAHPFLVHLWAEWSKVSRRNKSNREARPAAPLFESAAAPMRAAKPAQPAPNLVPPAQHARPAARESCRDGPEPIFLAMQRVVDHSSTSGERAAVRPDRTELFKNGSGPVRSAISGPIDTTLIAKLTLQRLGFREAEADELAAKWAKDPGGDWERRFSQAAACIGAERSGKVKVGSRVAYTPRIERIFQSDSDRAAAAYEAVLTDLRAQN